MPKRFDINVVDPGAIKAMQALERYTHTTSINDEHKEIIRLRASQINGCTFCIDLHTKEAKKAGLSEQKIALLSTWRDTSMFSKEERVLLALTEKITLIGDSYIPDKLYEKAISMFGEVYLAQVVMLVITINAWNRIAITSGLEPQPD